MATKVEKAQQVLKLALSRGKGKAERKVVYQQALKAGLRRADVRAARKALGIRFDRKTGTLCSGIGDRPKKGGK